MKRLGYKQVRELSKNNDIVIRVDYNYQVRVLINEVVIGYITFSDFIKLDLRETNTTSYIYTYYTLK